MADDSQFKTGRPTASSPSVRRRMIATKRRDTPEEVRLRRVLHRMGFRYSIDAAPLPGLRRRADILFRRDKLAVFVDGCFWHGCPIHKSEPKTNAEWWREKLAANIRRDRDTDSGLRAAGWLVIRVWAHEAPDRAAQRVQRSLARRRASKAGAARRGTG